MKTIGLIGGMSWESSAEYYRILNEKVKQELGGLHSAKCILFSVDFGEIEALQAKGDWEEAGKRMSGAAQSLEKAGADFLILCTNTMHKVADVVEEAVSIPMLHIADATAERVKREKIETIGLIGTKYTMEMSFYKERLKSKGLAAVIPQESERTEVNRIIFEELCAGETRQSSKKYFQEVIQKMVEKGAEGVILGCTEIGLLIKPEELEVPVFDTVLLHAQTAVKQALG